jgi:hypothetical protein
MLIYFDFTIPDLTALCNNAKYLEMWKGDAIK